MQYYISSFESFLLTIISIFRKETGQKFMELAFGWILQAGEKTTTGLIRALGGAAEKSFCSYHRFFNTTSWHPDQFWKKIAEIVLTLCDKVVIAGVDDTTLQKVGREISGTGWFPDKKTMYHKKNTYIWGLNWVVVGVLLPYPFGIDKVFCFPIMARLYRPKKECKQEGIEFQTRLEMLAEMLEKLGKWFPNRHFIVTSDSQYAGGPALEDLPENVTAIVRGKRNFTYHNLPPDKREPGRKGPDRKKGKRLDKPHQMANRETGWTEVEVDFYGDQKEMLVKTHVCLWYHVFGQEPIRLVVVKDPDRDCWTSFICTDTEIPPAEVIEYYCYRWSIEVTFRGGKGCGGLEDPQCRTDEAVTRQTPFNLGMISLVQVWFLKEGRDKYDPDQQEWESGEGEYSFPRLLNYLRWEVRRYQIIEKWGIDPTSEKKVEVSSEKIDELIDQWSSAA